MRIDAQYLLTAEIDHQQRVGALQAEPEQVRARARDRDLPQQTAAGVEDVELANAFGRSGRGEAEGGRSDATACGADVNYAARLGVDHRIGRGQAPGHIRRATLDRKTCACASAHHVCAYRAEVKGTCTYTEQAVVGGIAVLSEDGRVGVIQPEAACGRDGISGCRKYIVRERISAGNFQRAIGDSQKPVAGGAIDSEYAQARDEGEHGGAGGALVDDDAAPRRRQVVIAVACPSGTARAGESDGDHRSLAEVDRAIISEVAADG